jgi:hypothetical protein
MNNSLFSKFLFCLITFYSSRIQQDSKKLSQDIKNSTKNRGSDDIFSQRNLDMVTEHLRKLESVSKKE